MTTSFGVKTLAYLGNKLWQFLPHDINQSNTLSISKKRIKHWHVHVDVGKSPSLTTIRKPGFMSSCRVKGYVHISPFSFWSVFAPKNGAFFSSVHITPFSDTDIYQLVFTLFLKNATVFLFLTTRPSRLLILAFHIVPFLVFTLQSCVFV